MIRKKNQLYILAILILLTIYQLVHFHNPKVIQSVHVAYKKGDFSLRRLTERITKNQLVFPFNYPVTTNSLDLHITKTKLNLKRYKNPKVIKAESDASSLTKSLINYNYRKHQITVYNDLKSINLDMKQCDVLQTNMTIEIGSAISVDSSLVEILMNFVDQYSTNSYYREIAPLFMDQLKLQLEYNVVDHYWYRLAGSSVWLEQYQAHFMISRVLYSPSGERNKPALSLTYGQLFDKNWKELTNTKILVPTNLVPKREDTETTGESKPQTQGSQTDTQPSKVNEELSKADKESTDSSESDSVDESSSNESKQKRNEPEKHYKVLSFPYFLPIPFYHDFDDDSGLYYGSEDPRMLIIKNEAGYEEPLIIFNSHNRKFPHYDDDMDEQILVKPKFYRSLYLCWPWQFQRGKEIMDGYSDKEFRYRVYNKVVELKLKNLPRQKAQKNWTPFIDIGARTDGYDKYVHFIYRWGNLEVLKCDIVYGTGVCSFVYRQEKQLSTDAQVGPLRGGTQLININQLFGDKMSNFITENRKIWIGYARAHIDDCGCGSSMYRPNLVVLVQESSPENRPIYKLSHVSSSVSFDIPMVGFHLMKPQDLCSGPSILIPNGISSWDIVFNEDGSFDDFSTLSLSISDYTVHRIHLKGVLSELFREYKFNSPIDEQIGYNNDNIACAVRQSFEFCRDFGEEHKYVADYSDNMNLKDLTKLLDMGKFVEGSDGTFNLEHFLDYLNEDADIVEYESALMNYKMLRQYKIISGQMGKKGKGSL